MTTKSSSGISERAAKAKSYAGSKLKRGGDAARAAGLKVADEVDAFPVAAGPLHAGLFAGIGMASRLEDGLPGGNHTGGALTGGAQLQLELSTSLALTARFGLTRAHDETTREVMVGLSVY